MATFTNRATLTYSGGTTISNTVTGTVNETLALTKTALVDTYSAASRLVYILTLVNSGGALGELTLTDDLGAYTVNGASVYPLAFVEGSIKYFIDGVLQPTPTVVAGPPLVISGISLPAGADATVVYEADVTAFAPLAEGGTVTNTVTVGGIVSDSVTASETVTVETSPNLSIIKSLSPVQVGEDGAITYTFIIENSGNTEAVATDNVVVSDIFDPILAITSVTLDGVALDEGTGYTYDEATGLFATVQSVITVPAATFEENADGSFTVIPGRTVLTVSGTI